MNKVKQQLLLNKCKHCKYSSASIRDRLWCLSHKRGVYLYSLYDSIEQCKGQWFKPYKGSTK